MRSPRHTPAGRCTACGYPMDPGICPECGTDCPDVSHKLQFDRLGLCLAILLAISPILSVALTRAALSYATRCFGVAPDDPRVDGVLVRAYFIGLPAAVLVLALALAMWRVQRRRASAGQAIALFAFTMVGAAMSWVTVLVAVMIDLND